MGGVRRINRWDRWDKWDVYGRSFISPMCPIELAAPYPAAAGKAGLLR